VEMCIFYDNNGELIAGRYEVFLFMDGHAIGQGEFLLR